MAEVTLSYIETIEASRKAREKRLIEAERSWLTLSGLYSLKEGPNTFGSAAENDIILPGEGLPVQCGTFVLKGDNVTLKPAPGLNMLCNGGRVPARALHDDQTEQPDYLTIGALILVVIKRGGRSLLRMWDNNHPVRKHFAGLRYYPVDPAYQIEAAFTPYESPQMLQITDVLGNQFEMPHVGYVLFEWEGQQCKLQAVGDEQNLYLSFRDKTNGDTTYGGGREVETGLPKDGKVTIDFNLTHNPPCAYTDFATCPLPPAENLLPVRIEAGEQIYRKKMMR